MSQHTIIIIQGLLLHFKRIKWLKLKSFPFSTYAFKFYFGINFYKKEISYILTLIFWIKCAFLLSTYIKSMMILHLMDGKFQMMRTTHTHTHTYSFTVRVCTCIVCLDCYAYMWYAVNARFNIHVGFSDSVSTPFDRRENCTGFDSVLYASSTAFFLTSFLSFAWSIWYILYSSHV